MEELIATVPLVLRGETYEAGIERIRAQPADPTSPWQTEDELSIWLTFEQVGKYPGSTMGFGVSVPVKDSTHYYRPDEFLALIKAAGERRLEEIQVKADEAKARSQEKRARQKQLDVLVSQVTSSLKSAKDGEAVAAAADESHD